MLITARRVAPLALVLALGLCGVASAQERRFTLSGERVAIYNLAGTVVVEPGSGNAVTVIARVGGADAKELRFEEGPIENMTTLRVVYPGDRIVYRAPGFEGNSQVGVSDDGRFNTSESWRRRKVTISSRGRGTEAWADLRIQVPRGQRIDVNLAVGTMSATNVDGRVSLDAGSADITVSGAKGALSVDVGSGNVSLNGASGDVSIDTGSGDVGLRQVAADMLSVDTGSGNVTGTDLSAMSVNVDTGSGNVELSAVRSPQVSIDTGSGDVILDLTAPVTQLGIDTGSGNVTVRAPANLNATVSLETSSGDLETDFPLQVRRTGSDELRGKIGSGEGTITVETGSGDVKLLRR